MGFDSDYCNEISSNNAVEGFYIDTIRGFKLKLV
jgi:hypothetical protein